jgi:hypothetical protein
MPTAPGFPSRLIRQNVRLTTPDIVVLMVSWPAMFRSLGQKRTARSMSGIRIDVNLITQPARL